MCTVRERNENGGMRQSIRKSTWVHTVYCISNQLVVMSIVDCMENMSIMIGVSTILID